MPTHIGAERIAQMILFRDSESFLQGTDRMRAFQRQLLEIGLNLFTHPVSPESSCVGETVAEIEHRAAGSFFIVGVDRPQGQGINRPPPDTVIRAGDGVVLVSRDGHAHVVASLLGAPLSTI
jgi:voltage-gated potassium channel